MIKTAIDGSYVVALAYIDSTPIGFARIISDGVAYALLVDTMINPKFQRKGIGTKIVEQLIHYCKERKIFMMKLISSKEGKIFYQKIGFKSCSSDEPGMILNLTP
ncbi:MAG: GNAT family N-acetyltransferase [Oligoflexia bacterium]|nr:GNAT family N-acetyltransferase [Oligoflexia bacterium]MBF0367500.1 GNAT family N-acetyltransferase [Oligoflexia bacterium]